MLIFKAVGQGRFHLLENWHGTLFLRPTCLTVSNWAKSSKDLLTTILKVFSPQMEKENENNWNMNSAMLSSHFTHLSFEKFLNIFWDIFLIIMSKKNFHMINSFLK